MCNQDLLVAIIVTLVIYIILFYPLCRDNYETNTQPIQPIQSIQPIQVIANPSVQSPPVNASGLVEARLTGAEIIAKFNKENPYITKPSLARYKVSYGLTFKRGIRYYRFIRIGHNANNVKVPRVVLSAKKVPIGVLRYKESGTGMILNNTSYNASNDVLTMMLKPSSTREISTIAIIELYGNQRKNTDSVLYFSHS